MIDDVVFVVAMFATVFCAAVNGYTYQVAYPLWRSVGEKELAGMHREYLRRLWPVITVPHVVMFFASGALIWLRPAFMPLWTAVLVFALDAGVVVVSAFAAGPIHDRITKLGAMDETGYRGLMSISAMRVVMMALASGMMFAVMLRAIVQGLS
jgi:hypothetical protein